MSTNDAPAVRGPVQISRRGQVEPFHVMEVLRAAAERAASHGDVISLCAGQPSTPAPAPVRRAALEALNNQVLGYSEALGLRALRVAIAQFQQERYAIDIDGDAIAVTTGSSGAFTAIFLAAFDVGDTVVMARPGYPAYRNTLQALGCRVLEIDCGSASRYQLTVAQLDALPEPPAGVIIASPANPTGTIIEARELEAIAHWCVAHGTLLISDEIYHGISFGRTCASAWQFSQETVVVGSFSKYFSMTGWRLGWVQLPAALRRPIELLSGNLSICPPVPAQAAAIAAFAPESLAELDTHVGRYAFNRELVLRRLPELGVTEVAPADGAFYAYADISHLTNDSTAWCAQVLAATGVAITPGVDFDTKAGSRFTRLSLAGGTEEVDEAMSRLARYVNGS